MKLRMFRRNPRYHLELLWKWFVAALHGETALYHAWREAGSHNSGYASASGIVVLPPSVRKQFKLPCLLMFVPDGRGGFHISDPAAIDDLEVSTP